MTAALSASYIRLWRRTSGSGGKQRNLSMLKNELARHGDGEFLLLLNPDVVLLPQWDDRMIAFLERTAEAGAVLPLPAGDLRHKAHWKPFVHGWLPRASLPTAEEMEEAKARAEFDVEAEFSHRSAVLRALGTGKLQKWHLLNEAQRARVRADPAYSHIGAAAP